MNLCTPRLRLRLPTRADATALSAIMHPAISARLASWPTHLDPIEAERRIADNLAAHASGQCLPLLICGLDDDAPLGWISAGRDKAAPTRAILTYWLGCTSHGQGLMREAAPPALQAAFTVLGVAEIRAAVQSDNLNSRSVLRSLGMHLIGDGHIWSATRNRDEACEWWAIASPAGLAQSAMSVVATPPTESRLHAAAD